jgi:hypothetical protein
VPPQHRTPRPARLILAFTSLVVLSPFVVVSGGDSTGAAPVSTQQPIGGQPATAGAAAIVNFEDLIRQDLRHPPASPTVRARAQTDTNEPRESPMLGPREVLPRPGDGTQSLWRAPALSIGPSPAPLTTFASSFHDYTPPDTNGVVGLEHVLSVTNPVLEAHTKTGAFIGSVSNYTFWRAANVLGTPFDPHALYDHVNHRFIVVALDYAGPGGSNTRAGVLVAISQTRNLLGNWVMMRYPVCEMPHPCGPTGHEWWADFDWVGLSRNFLTVSFTMFPREGYRGGDLRTLVINYPALLVTGQGLRAPATMFTGYNWWGVPVADQQLADADLYFIGVNSRANARLNRLTGPPDAPVFTTGPPVTYAPRGTECGGPAPQAPEPGTGNVVGVPDYFSLNAVLRNDHVWLVIPIKRLGPSNDCHAVVYWAKVDKSGALADGGFIEDSGDRWYIVPSIAVNRYNDVLVGFTQASPTEFLSAAYAFREGADPAGAMRDPRVFKNGEGHYNARRWGDYTNTVVDPADDTTLWTVQEYARPPVGVGAGSGRWRLAWASVNTRVLQPPGPVRTLQASSAGSSVQLTWAAPADGGAPTAYWIEAGSAPGLANLARFSTGSAAVSYAASGVPDGTYFVRVKGSNGAGVGPASNEAQLVVGCTSPPGPPAGLSIVQNSGGTVVLAWTQSGGGPTSYIIEAGSAPGLANLATIDLGRPDLAFTATGVPRGTYYVRVRGRNRCGTGAASNEVAIVVT